MRKSYNAKNAFVSGPYSHAIDGGDYIFFSGQTAMNTLSKDDAKEIQDDIAAQTEQCFKNLFDVMEETDLTEADVVKVHVYLTDMNDFEAVNAVYEKQFSAPHPARTCIAVLALPLGANIEIEMIAKARTK